MFEPRWKYHREKGGRIVRSQKELDELGPDWADSPLAFGQITCPSEFQDEYDPALDTFAGVKRGPGRPKANP